MILGHQVVDTCNIIILIFYWIYLVIRGINIVVNKKSMQRFYWVLPQSTEE
jgi:uncharacterized membrane protein (DUF106 family)